MLVATGSVAAAIAVIVGIASMNTGSDNKSMASSPTKENASTPQAAGDNAGVATSAPPNLGDVTKPEALRAPAERLLANAPVPVADGAPEATGKAVAPGTSQQNGSAARLRRVQVVQRAQGCRARLRRRGNALQHLDRACLGRDRHRVRPAAC